MINIQEAEALSKWIHKWKKTYAENPSLEECFTWFEWQFKNKDLSNNERKSIKKILEFNSEDSLT
tara:strand:- start:474 stop:668 length:195 start_codon:yes stop_codon:yes gene_type:complete